MSHILHITSEFIESLPSVRADAAEIMGRVNVTGLAADVIHTALINEHGPDVTTEESAQPVQESIADNPVVNTTKREVGHLAYIRNQQEEDRLSEIRRLVREA